MASVAPCFQRGLRPRALGFWDTGPRAIPPKAGLVLRSPENNALNDPKSCASWRNLLGHLAQEQGLWVAAQLCYVALDYL